MKQIFVLLILILFLSCRQRTNHEIDLIMIDPTVSDSAGLSEIASGIEKIILETKDSCLISGVQEIEKTTKLLFINDGGKRVLQFASSGSFIKQIGSEGRGPGEYQSVFGMALDTVNNNIYIATFRKIMCFDFSGRFLNEIKQQGYSEFIIVVGNKLWTVSTSLGNKSEDNSFINVTRLIRYSLPGSESDTIIVKKLILPSLSGTMFPQAYYISDLGNTQYLYFPILTAEPVLRDTLYEVAKNSLIPSIKFDFGKEGVPQNGKKPVFIKNIYKTSNYLFAEYSFQGKNMIYCLDGRNKISFVVSEGFRDDYFNTGIIHLKPLDLKNESMYFVKDAFFVKDKIIGVSENSNPVIFIVKLKDK